MIEFKNVSKHYNEGEIKALKNINLKIEKGDIFGFIGKSGAGKSTLIRLINKIEKPTKGKITIKNQNLSKLKKSELINLRRNIGMIFQNFNLMFSKTVKENILFPLKISKTKYSKEYIDKKIDEVLRLIDLKDKINEYPKNLSGGQKQRVAIARAIINDPEILLCDEATSALDPETTFEILRLLKKINKDLNITIVLITHELEVIKKLCTKTAVLYQGDLIDIDSTENIFSKTSINTKTKKLLEVKKWSV